MNKLFQVLAKRVGHPLVVCGIVASLVSSPAAAQDEDESQAPDDAVIEPHGHCDPRWFADDEPLSCNTADPIYDAIVDALQQPDNVDGNGQNEP